MARLRHSVSGGKSRRFAGNLGPVNGAGERKSGLQLAAVEEFHRECLRVAVEVEKSRGFPKKRGS